MRDHAVDDSNRQDAAVRLERAGWRDLRAIAAIQKASFRPGLAYGLSGLSLLSIFPGVVFLIARTATVPVAGCIIADRHRGNVRVMNLAVDPAARRQGVGTALLRGVESAFPSGDIMLMAEEWNTGAQALYEREGFGRNGTSRDYYGPGRHGILMKKARNLADSARPPRIQV